MPQAGVGTSDAFLGQLLHMMTVQQQAMQLQQQQFQSFMEQQSNFQREMFEQQSRATRQKHKTDPQKFYGRAGEDLELWLFSIEEHLSSFAVERDSCDSRFVDMVVPFLGPDAMSWYRELKNILGDQPRTWFLFKQQIRVRFRESDFEFKLLSKLHDLQVTGTQHEYTSKFMLLLSQSSLELPEMVKRWLYQENLRPDTSSHISQNIPLTLQETIDHAQRFEDARKPSKFRQNQPQNQNQKGSGSTSTSTSASTRLDAAGSTKPNFRKSKPASGTSQPKVTGFVPTCHHCGVEGHIAPACPDRQQGGGGKPKN
ncbi:hypothetical protein PR003_g26767 [Phytophthora rubi]|uniref:CCHC-type domain-containing protein n=1 Tax=Phytophthora rubi TaxID=129364 RepID=A0A6A3HW94_9STRA|nr:hypothetical protein PR002_g25741 [Phytophthora rubi]KAE9284772.1 hypothetical protein PR003_g26767 [Phytophthora rubi]